MVYKIELWTVTGSRYRATEWSDTPVSILLKEGVERFDAGGWEAYDIHEDWYLVIPLHKIEKIHVRSS